mgnify:CR=1 FL=1
MVIWRNHAFFAIFFLSDAAAGINGQIVWIAGQELALVTHPMIAAPVLNGDWTFERVAEAFRTMLGARQQKLGLAYAASEPEETS